MVRIDQIQIDHFGLPPRAVCTMSALMMLRIRSARGSRGRPGPLPHPAPGVWPQRARALSWPSPSSYVPLAFEKISSMGLKSGEKAGRNQSSQPRPSMSSLM